MTCENIGEPRMDTNCQLLLEEYFVIFDLGQGIPVNSEKSSTVLPIVVNLGFMDSYFCFEVNLRLEMNFTNVFIEDEECKILIV